MANVLSSEEREQILALGRLGWSLRRIEAETGVRRETASRYPKAAAIALRHPCGWGHGEAKAAKETSTDSAASASVAPPGRSPQASACEPYREWIEQAVHRGRQAMAIWQDLVDDPTNGFDAGYASVQRFVRKLRETQGREAHPVIVSAPAEEGQVYGEHFAREIPAQRWCASRRPGHVTVEMPDAVLEALAAGPGAEHHAGVLARSTVLL
jgi:transposase